MFALAIPLVYLTWRGLTTLNFDAWWVAVPLFGVEVLGAFGLGMFTFLLWNVDVRPSRRIVTAPPGRIAVLITTLDEPLDVLRPTIMAAVAIRIEHETWVLDDGHRPEVAALARECGASYLSRPDNAHAKAGNLNYGIANVSAEFYATFDADHVARPDFLEQTLGYFDDPQVALVQTPQEFYNVDSIEHYRKGDTWITDESLVYRAVIPGLNRWDGAYWCGTNAVIRASALAEVGGVAPETVTEDIHTSVRIMRRGWRIVYHNQVLALGLAPMTHEAHIAQRRRWAAGAMQVLRLECPLTVSGLRLRQRLSLTAAFLGWFESWRTVAFVLLPIAVIITGSSPLDASGRSSGDVIPPVYLCQLVAYILLNRGWITIHSALVTPILTLPGVFPGTFAIFRPRQPRRYRVTPKGQTAGTSRPSIHPLLAGLWLASVAALLWYAATQAGLTFTSYETAQVGQLGAFFAGVNVLLMSLVFLRVWKHR